MALNLDDDQVLKRYLLGELSEEERAAVQDRLTSDEDYFDFLCTVETDLLDAYVRGELSAGEREQVERSLLTAPHARARLAFAKALAAETARTGRKRLPVWRTGPSILLAAAGLVVVVGIGFLALQNRKLGEQIATLETQRSALQSAEHDLELRLNRAQTGSGAPVTMSVLLSPGVVRGAGQAKQIAVPASTQLVELQLDPEGDRHAAYRVTLKTTAGAKVWEQTNLAPQSTPAGRMLSVWLPASALARGDYELTLEGISNGGKAELAGYYYFKIN